MPEIGFCGDDCGLCPRRVATASGDTEKLKEVAAMWKRAGWRDEVVRAEEMICRGCGSVSWCRYDDIRKCARDKGVSNCGRCDSYPCHKIAKVFEQTDDYARHCKGTCSADDYECFQKAFFSKRKTLDAIHSEYVSQIRANST